MIPAFSLHNIIVSQQVKQDRLNILFKEKIKTPPFLYSVIIEGRDWFDKVNGNPYHSFSAQLHFSPKQEPIIIVHTMSYGRFKDFWEQDLIYEMHKKGIVYTRINDSEMFFLLEEDDNNEYKSVSSPIWTLRRITEIITVKKVKEKDLHHRHR